MPPDRQKGKQLNKLFFLYSHKKTMLKIPTKRTTYASVHHTSSDVSRLHTSVGGLKWIIKFMKRRTRSSYWEYFTTTFSHGFFFFFILRGTRHKIELNPRGKWEKIIFRLRRWKEEKKHEALLCCRSVGFYSCLLFIYIITFYCTNTIRLKSVEVIVRFLHD